MNPRLISSLLMAGLGCIGSHAWAQSARSTPAPATVAQASPAQKPSNDVEAAFKRAVVTSGTPYVPTSSPPIPTVEVKGIDDVIGKNPIATLKAGKSMSAQLSDMATAAGWMLIWDAPDFSIEQPVNVSSDFFKAIDTIIESAVQAGTRLKATFYRGNNTLRITEF